MTRFMFRTLMTLALLTGSASGQGWAEKMIKGDLTHDFGTHPRGGVLTHSFTITNIYAVRMEILSLKSGCGCVTAEAKKRVLEPRESTAIEVRMDTRRFTGPKTVGVRVTVGPEFVSSAELRVTGNCRTDIVFNPGQVNFGTITRGQAPAQVVDVEYVGPLAWQVEEVIAKDMPFTAEVKELYRRPGGVGYRLTVTAKADSSSGTHKHTIFLKNNDPASPMVPLLVEATFQAAVSVTPEILSLGDIKADSPLIRRVVVRGNRPFQVTGVEGTGAGIELGAPLATTDEAVQVLTFKCQPTAVGPFRMELKIKTTLQTDPVILTIDGTASK